jgi:flagellar hook-basal body complex protein FliE
MSVAMPMPPAGLAGVERLLPPGGPIAGAGALPGISPLVSSPVPTLPNPTSTTFAQLLTDGFDRVSANMNNADKMVRAFALDDSIPVHQVTFALEQARLSMELLLQVRGRLVESYQQLMNMQL